MSLADILTDASRKNAVIDDCLDILEKEVADKSGLSGMAVKAGYKAVKGFKPGFVRNVIHDLLPEFAAALDPIAAEATSQDRSVSAHLMANSGRVADALLAITDKKAERSKNKLVKGTYEKLRGTAKKNVEQAVPRLGALIEKYSG